MHKWLLNYSVIEMLIRLTSLIFCVKILLNFCMLMRLVRLKKIKE